MSHFVIDLLTSRSQRNEQLLTLDFPPALQQRVMNALRADPKSVDIRNQAPHFYTLATRILEIFEDENMTEVLIDVG